MTEQEAEVLAARLTKVWRPENVEFAQRDEYLDLEWRAELGDGFIIDIQMGRDEVRINFTQQETGQGLGFETEFGIYTIGHYSQLQDVRAEQNKQKLIDEWMPFFRRSCWLSGCNIEASAHEKAEWMQGFPREELQAWNLEF